MYNKQNSNLIHGSITEFLESRFEETTLKSITCITDILYQGIQCENSRFFIVRKDEERNSYVVAIKFDTEFGVTLCLAFVLPYKSLTIAHKIANASYNIHDMQNRIESNRSLMGIFNNIEDIHNLIFFMRRSFAGNIMVTRKILDLKIEVADSQRTVVNTALLHYPGRSFSLKLGGHLYACYGLKIDDLIELNKYMAKYSDNIKQLLDDYCRNSINS